MRDWSLYIVRCGDGNLYTGITTDVNRRLAQHRSNQGAKYLRGREPLTLVFQQRVGDRGRAQRMEARVKKMRRAAKERLIAAGDDCPRFRG
jgi:putative endonuclease